MVELAEEALAPDTNHLSIHHLARQIILQAGREIIDPHVEYSGYIILIHISFLFCFHFILTFGLDFIEPASARDSLKALSDFSIFYFLFPSLFPFFLPFYF